MSREAWQAECTARNFPNGDGPFLAAGFLEEESAWDFFANSGYRNFDTFIAKRRQAVEALDEELKLVVPQVQSMVYAGMKQAIAQGYVPPAALGRVETAFTQTAIQAVDPAVFKDGASLAHYRQRTDTMVISSEAIDYDLPETIAHELGGHKISGGTFVTTRGCKMLRTRRGFVNDTAKTFSSAGRHYGLDEAVQQHLTQAYINGQIDVLNPDDRDDNDASGGYESSYYQHRKLLAAFISRSGGIIDLATITRASFEDTEATGIESANRRAMTQQALAAYGPGAYRKLSLLFDAIDIYGDVTEELTQYIQPPELGQDGSVQSPGTIQVHPLFQY